VSDQIEPVFSTGRLVCERCLRPRNTCICHWIVATLPLVELLILQHPLEVHQAKGSARLLHLSLNGSQLLTGEIFDDAYLERELYCGGKTPILLYPENPVAGDLLRSPPALTPDILAQPERLRLVVLDGTWRKSRKMLYQNRLLQELPRLPLSDMPASHYRIRKAHKPDQLSTLEASCQALIQLEDDAEKYQPLLNAFDGFIDQQLSFLATAAPEK
jgi:DTW domain-containing protein YfiP